MEYNTNNKPYRCVVCGTTASALTKSYGPTVLKLSTCEWCGSIVDKYIEYDPVIVIIDLVLVTREAQRHILHNTSFKIFWKLLLFLSILETYGVWCKKNIINLVIETICTTVTDFNSTNVNASSSGTYHYGCLLWLNDTKIDDADPFISEKTFYIASASIFLGTLVFTITILALSKFAKKGRNVSLLSLLKAVAIGSVANIFTLPLLIWGIPYESSKYIHILLVFGYTFLVFLNALAVTYDFNMVTTAGILLLAYTGKFATVFISKLIIEMIT